MSRVCSAESDDLQFQRLYEKINMQSETVSYSAQMQLSLSPLLLQFSSRSRTILGAVLRFLLC